MPLFSLGGRCGTDVGIRSGSVGGGSDVCHTLLGTSLAPGMWALPSPGEAYGIISFTGQTCIIDVNVGIPVRSMGGGSDVVTPFWNWWGSRHPCHMFYIWQTITTNTIITTMSTPSQSTGWTEQPTKTKAAIMPRHDFGKILGHTVRGRVTANKSSTPRYHHLTRRTKHKIPNRGCGPILPILLN